MSTQPWPDEVRSLVEQFAREKEMVISLREKLLEGKSGASASSAVCSRRMLRRGARERVA